MRFIARYGWKITSRDVRWFWLCVLLWSAAMSMPAEAQEQQGRLSAAEREIRATQDARFWAVTHQDAAALDTLFAPELTYTHSDAEQDTKASFLADMKSGTLLFTAALLDSVRVRAYGTTAVSDGRVKYRGRLEGKEFEFTVRFIEVYVQRRGRWQLVAYQSTRILL